MNHWMTVAMLLWAGTTAAQGFRPPPFIGGVPGAMQFQAIQMQRHQARTLLYREALDELRRNPAAADVPDCPSDGAKGALCLAKTVEIPSPPPPSTLSVPTTATASKPVVPPRRRLAVLIGNNDYPSPIPALETPVADIGETADLLHSKFGFDTHVLKNASKTQIIESLNRMATEATPDDSVLLFYAGHGYLMDDTKMGYWIPVDASVKTATGWISNTDIGKLLSAIRARQIILVSDSCFSGSLTHEQKVTQGAADKPEEVLHRRSVVVLSSGGDEPVSDEGKEGHSIFAWNLIRALAAANGITPGFDVYQQVRSNVMKEYPQEPQYGAVVSAGHTVGGEFLFDTGRQ